MRTFAPRFFDLSLNRKKMCGNDSYEKETKHVYTSSSRFITYMLYQESIHIATRTFALPFFNHFSLSLNRKKCVVMGAMRKKLNEHIYTPSNRFITYQNRKSQLVQMQTLQKRSERNRLSLLKRGGCNAYCLG